MNGSRSPISQSINHQLVVQNKTLNQNFLRTLFRFYVNERVLIFCFVPVLVTNLIFIPKLNIQNKHLIKNIKNAIKIEIYRWTGRTEQTRKRQEDQWRWGRNLKKWKRRERQRQPCHDRCERMALRLWLRLSLYCHSPLIARRMIGDSRDKSLNRQCGKQ